MRENKFLFFTATIRAWKKLLKPDKYKDIIVSSLRYLTEKKKIFVYAFVIMPNHIHLIWNIREPFLLENVQRDFLKYTAQMIRFDLQKKHPKVLEYFKSIRKDREYQFWQDRSYNNVLHNRKVIEQKVDYIHNNPIQERWKLVEKSQEYEYSTAKYYHDNIDEWGFITNYIDHS